MPTPLNDLDPLPAQGGKAPLTDLDPPAQQQGLTWGQQLADIGRVTARGLVKGAVGAAAWPADIAVQAGRVVGLPKVGWNPATSEELLDPQLSKVISPPRQRAGQLAETGISMLAGGGLAQAGLKAGARALGAGVQAAQRVLPRVTQVTVNAAKQAQTYGYKLLPQEIGGGISQTAQRWSGLQIGREENAAINEATTDSIAKQELGIPPDRDITPSELEKLRNIEYQTYEQMRGIGRVTANPEFHDALAHAGDRFLGTESFGPLESDPLIKAARNRFNKPSYEVSDLVSERQRLSKAAAANLRNYEPNQNAVGYTQREIIKAIDAELERVAENPVRPWVQRDPVTGIETRQLGTPVPGGGQALRDARTQLAKIQDYEDALGAGGHISAHDMARIAEKKPLTGGAKVIADTAANFWESTRPMAGAGRGAPQGMNWSAVDYLAGGTGLVTGHLGVTALAAVRAPARAVSRTEFAQGRMLRGLEKRAAAKGPSAARRAAKEIGKAAVTGAAMQRAVTSYSDMDSDLK